ncbi:MAG TPA: S41 family peptidase [Thermoanaerobaculia bacterium]|nr:S41 family peptidase [Thermoanaerobaculia bacterium]
MTKKKIAFLTISVAFLITLLGGALFGQASSKTSIYRPLSIFTEVFDLVRSNYVESVSSDQLLEGAFNGVTDAIDEFSYYVPPTQMATYKSFTDTDDNGTGLIVSRRFGYAYVISAVPGSPAAKAGVERGDFIDKIDGKSTTKMAVWQMKNALAASHPVELSVLHGGQTKREPFKLEHANFHPVNVTTKQYGNVAVITIPYFDKGTEAQFRAALDNVRKAGTRKLIVDVRGNAAGDIDEAIASADDLLTSGLITSLEGRRIDMKKWQADRNTAYDGDVEVLTDASTAAGGEIFAAAIHGNSRGKTVGVTTYGKSIVQKFITLPSGGGVYMTVAHYTTPDLKPIKDGGVKPDVLVDLSSQALRDPNDKSASSEPREDLIMEKALSLYGENVSVAPKKAA